MPIAPSDRGLYSLRSVALAVRVRGEHPTNFRHRERRFDAALVIAEADLAREIACGLLLHHPIAEAEQFPMADVAQESGPGFFGRERSASDVARDYRIGPHGCRGSEIVHDMTTEDEAFGFKDGDHADILAGV